MNDKKRSVIIALIGIPLIILASYFITTLEGKDGSNTIKEDALLVLNEEVDFSQTLYPPEDHEYLRKQLRLGKEELEGQALAEFETMANLATLYKDIRDYAHALQLYALLDRMNPGDKNYILERAQIFMAQGDPERAISEIQPLKQSWPVPETFLYLADAYKYLDGTPDYVIDDIYEEGIYRHNGISDITWAYIRWLERTDREAETLEYYELLYERNQDPEILQKIQELKIQYG